MVLFVWGWGGSLVGNGRKLFCYGLHFALVYADDFHEVSEQANFQVLIAMNGDRNSGLIAISHIHMVATLYSGEHPTMFLKQFRKLFP